MTDNDINESAASSGGRITDAVRKYIDACRAKGRLATAAGFRAYAGITSDIYDRLLAGDPDAADVIRSLFIDEAVNSKAANPAQTIRFILSAADSITDDTTIDVDLGDGE